MLATIAKVVVLSATSTLLLTPCHAQSLNDSSVQECPSPIRTIVNGRQPFNSTGTVRLAPGPAQKDSWYLSLTITDRRDPQYIYGDSATWQEREGFLSVPESLAGSREGNQTEYCMYMLPSRDATSQEQPGNCTGLLSDECMTALQHNTPSFSDGKCQKPNNLEDACGTMSPLGMSKLFPYFLEDTLANNAPDTPSNFSSSNCTLARLPHVDLPEEYRTYGYLPVSMARGGDDRGNFDLYDKHVREAVPLVLSIKALDGIVEHKVVCLAPDNVVDGSRDPESAAARVSSRVSIIAALAVTGLISFMY